jgi:hypothetical protein
MNTYISEFLDILMGFRKLIAFAGLFILAIAFRLKGLIDGGQMVDLLKNTFVAFVAANGVEHFTTMVKDHMASKIALNISDTLPSKEEG